MSRLSLPSLPLGVLYQILSQCSIPDVIAVSIALAKPSLTDIFKISKLWKQAVIGPRMLDRSVHFLGDHVDQIIIRGRLQFDRNCKPRKEKFFKSCELLPEHVLSCIRSNCQHIKTLILDQCVLGPHINASMFPRSLKKLVIRSTITVKKSSFFSKIWSHLPNLKELRVENIQILTKMIVMLC
jgi:hypothetical protein